MDNSKLPSLLHFKVEKATPIIIENEPNIEPIITDNVDEPEPELNEIIPDDKPTTAEQMGLKVVKRPKIKPEKIFEEPTPPKKSRKQIKYVEVSSSDEEPDEPKDRETGEVDPNFIYEPEPEVEPEPEPKIEVYEEPEPEPKPKKVKKGRKPMTAEHKEKLRVALKIAREKKQELIAEKKKSGYKTTSDIKKERANRMSVQKGKTEVYEEQRAEMKRLKDELEKEKQKSKLVEEKKQENIITKEDLQKSQLQTLATFEMLRKERKEEKKKQKQIEAYNDSVKETIKNINKTPTYMRRAGRYKNYLDGF